MDLGRPKKVIYIPVEEPVRREAPVEPEPDEAPIPVPDWPVRKPAEVDACAS